MKTVPRLHQRFLGLGIALAGILVTGTLGYRVLEGWSALDAVYMTVITITSVGFTEVHPLSAAGRVFTIGLIVVGLGVVGYGFSASEMLRPQVVWFLDAMRSQAEGALRVEEIEVPAESPWVGQPLAETRIRERVGVVIFGLREGASGRYLFNPEPGLRLRAGDVLIGCANPDQLATLRRLATGG